jgi:DNA-binding transcriptional MocR family regulator
MKITLFMAMSSSNSREVIKAHLRKLCETETPGFPLPSVRALCRQFTASPVTIIRAISELSEEGQLDARPGHGTFVRAKSSSRKTRDDAWQSLVLGAPPPPSMNNLVTTPPPGCLNFASGYMEPSILPDRELSRASARALKTTSPWQRAPTSGIPELRSWFAERAAPGLPSENALIVHGGQAALGIAIRATVPTGGVLLVESPTYLGPLVIARAAGIRLAPVPVDNEGMRADYLEQAFESTGAKVVYLQPNFSNPTGATMSASRRDQVLMLARKFNAFIIEDDYARDLSFSGRVIPPMMARDDGHVIYVRSLTKSIAPSLRVAALCASGPVFSRLQSALLVNDFFVPRPLQEIAREFISHPSYATHLKRVQQTFSSRMQRACSLLSEKLPECSFVEPNGGYSLWLGLPDGTEEDLLCQAAERLGVLVNPGHWWFAAEPTGRFLRLSIAGLDEAAIDPAVERLSQAMRVVKYTSAEANLSQQ